MGYIKKRLILFFVLTVAITFFSSSVVRKAQNYKPGYKEEKAAFSLEVKKLKKQKEGLSDEIIVLSEKKVKLEREIAKWSNIEKEIKADQETEKEKAFNKELIDLTAKLNNAIREKELLEIKYQQILAEKQALMADKEAVIELKAVKDEPGPLIRERKNKKLVNAQVQASSDVLGFIIINIGKEDGIAVGDIYYVLRGPKRIAEIEITKISDKSACAMAYFIEESERIIAGDSVR